MKTQKIFLLVIALTLALFVLASCSSSKTGPDCFVFNDEPSFKVPTEYEGKIIAVNEDYNLVAFETWSLGTNGYSSRVVKVIDVSDENRVVLTKSWTKSPNSTNSDVEIDLDSYPVIKLSEEYQNGTQNGIPVYKIRYDYYLIHEDKEASSLSSSSDGDVLKVEEISNIWLVEDEDTVYWVNKNLEIMREIPSVIADTYYRMDYMSPDRYFQFESEYCDYLYTWEFDAEKLSQIIVVYDPNGIACAKYSPSYRGFAPSVYVLNNGNVLIQEQQIADDGEPFEYVYPNGLESYNMNLVTKIMDYKTGAVTEVEFNYIISDFESNYEASEASSSFPLTLSKKYANQAYITPIADGKIGNVTEYVVINDELQIQWTLNNKYLAQTGAYRIVNPSKERYFAVVQIDGKTAACMFDWAGNIIFEAPANANGVTNDFYLTKSGIYTYDGKLVFDINNSDFCDAEVHVIGNCIYFLKENDLKSERFEEVYKFNAKTKNPELIADGDETDFDPLTKDGAFIVVNDKKSTLTVYDSNGKIALVTRTDSNMVDTYSCKDMFIIEVEVGGEYKAYIFAYGDQIIMD